MKSKKVKIIAGLVLALLIIAAVLLYVFLSPAGTAGEKDIVFQVTHTDGSVKDFAISTDSENLRGALEQEGLISGEESSYGLYVTVIDGEEADDSLNQWWCFTQDGVMLNTGVDDTMINDGDHYEAAIDTY